MNHLNSDHELSRPATRLANVPLLGWLVAVALSGLYYYFDAFAVYRDIRGFAKDRVEDYCLWLAAIVAAFGIVTSVVGLVMIRRSGGRFRGSYRLIVGMVINLLTLLAVLFELFVRGIVNGANAA